MGDKFLVYFGTNTSKESLGIYCNYFNAKIGIFGKIKLVYEINNPTYQFISKSNRILFSTSEVRKTNEHKQGQLHSFKILNNGNIKLINSVLSGGMGPSYIDYNPIKNILITSNIWSGNISSFKIKDNGHISRKICTILEKQKGSFKNSKYQDMSHPHSINFSSDYNYSIACDRGSDLITIYKCLDNGNLRINSQYQIKKGSGPRHMVFDKKNNYIYVLNELNSSIIMFKYKKNNGEIEYLDSIGTLPNNYTEQNMTSEIQISNCGKFLYCTNRGHNSIALYHIKKNGRLKILDHFSTLGNWPRSFILDPTGKWLIVCNEYSNDVYIFKINKQNGSLKRCGEKTFVHNPTCIQFMNN